MFKRSVRHAPVPEVRAMDRVKRQLSEVLGESAISSGSLSFTSGSGNYENHPAISYLQIAPCSERVSNVITEITMFA